MPENREPALLELGRIIHDARCAKGIKRDELAEQVGVTKRFLSAVENGEKRPKYETLRAIIHCLGISADQIFYPELDNDSDAQQVVRLYENCNDREKLLIKALLNAIYSSK